MCDYRAARRFPLDSDGDDDPHETLLGAAAWEEAISTLIDRERRFATTKRTDRRHHVHPLRTTRRRSRPERPGAPRARPGACAAFDPWRDDRLGPVRSRRL